MFEKKLFLANKLTEKKLDPCHTKKHYQSFIRKKKTKSVTQSEITTHEPKTFENPNIVDIKWNITEDPKILHKLLKTIKKAGKVGSNSSLYCDTKKTLTFYWKKITKRAHAFKDFASTYNVQILDSFNRELQLKDPKSAIKSKLIYLLTELKRSKFTATLVLLFKNIKSEDKKKYDTFYSHPKAEIIINGSDIDNVFK